MPTFPPNATEFERNIIIAPEYLPKEVGEQCEKIQKIHKELEEASKVLFSKELLEPDIEASKATAMELKEAAYGLASRTVVYGEKLGGLREALVDDTF
jgi:hypothetical protein